MTKLRHLEVEGFKGAKFISVNLNDFTLITGNCKTSLLEALALMMQSKGEEWLMLEGKYLVIFDPLDAIYMHDPSNRLRVRMDFEVDEYGESLAREIGLELKKGSLIGYEYSLRLNDYTVEQAVYLNGEEVAAIAKIGHEGVMLRPVKARLRMAPTHVLNEDAFLTCDDAPRLAYNLLFVLRNMLRDRFYFLSERRACSWKREFEEYVDLPRNYVGSEGQYTAYQLSLMTVRPELEEKLEEFKELLKAVGIEDIKAGFTSPPKRLGVFVKEGGVWVSIMDASFKVRALLPILTQLVLTPSDSILIIDYVDLGLNRSEAKDLLYLIRDYAAKRGVQVIATCKEEIDGFNTVKISCNTR